MTKKTRFIVLAAIAAAVAAIVLALLLRKEPAVQEEQKEPVYDRMANPEYRKIIDFEKEEQKKAMGEIAKARQNLAEAEDAKLDPEIIKELESEVAKAENELELERERMRANLRRELWKEQHPREAKILDENRVAESKLMAEIDEAKARLESAEAAGAPESETSELKGKVESLLAELEKVHVEAEKALRNVNSK